MLFEFSSFFLSFARTAFPDFLSQNLNSSLDIIAASEYVERIYDSAYPTEPLIAYSGPTEPLINQFSGAMVALPVGFIATAILVHIVKENQSKAKHQQV